VNVGALRSLRADAQKQKTERHMFTPIFYANDAGTTTRKSTRVVTVTPKEKQRRGTEKPKNIK
jgi:hypothetical protein